MAGLTYFARLLRNFSSEFYAQLPKRDATLITVAVAPLKLDMNPAPIHHHRYRR
jgi:hypothetical protein